MEKRQYNTPRIITTFVEIVEVLLIGLKKFILKFGDAILQVGRVVIGFLVSSASILGLLAVFLGFIFLTFEYYGPLEYIPFDLKRISGSASRDIVLGISGTLLIIVPLIMTLSLGLLLLFKKYLINKKIGLGLGMVWLLSIMSFGISMAFTVPNFTEEAEVVRETRLDLPEGQMSINLLERRFKSYPALSVQVFEAEGNQLIIEEHISSQGNSLEDAKENASACHLSYTLTDSIFEIERDLKLDEGQEFRGQRACLRIGIPTESVFKLNRKAFYEVNNHHELWTDYGAHHHYYSYDPGPYVVDDKKLILVSRLNESDRRMLSISGALEVELHAEDEPTMVVTNGNAEDLTFYTGPNETHIGRDNSDSSLCMIDLNLKGPIHANLQNGAILKSRYFNRENCVFDLFNSSADLKLVDINSLELTLDESSSLVLSGSAEHVLVHLEGGASFDYSSLNCPSVEIVKKSED